jgi:menaquinone-dependent protoporphyrinogen IX oxidase
MQRRSFFKLGLTGIGTVALAHKGWALEYYPMPSDKKWAVVYGTWCGSSRDAAVWISEGMGGIANVFDVRENPDLTVYDYIVLGGSIRSSATSQELKDFITQNKSLLKQKVRGLFAVCGNMGSPVGPQQTVTFIDNHLARLCEVSNLPSKVFLGRITKSLMDTQTAAMMASLQDYDNLKRADCMAFGQDVLRSVTPVKKSSPERPKEFKLNQNYPNPFNPSTEIQYSLNNSGKVMLQIFDTKGKKVRTLLDHNQSSGTHFIRWDSRDEFGNDVASGAYFCLLSFNGNIISKKLLKVK